MKIAGLNRQMYNYYYLPHLRIDAVKKRIRHLAADLEEDLLVNHGEQHRYIQSINEQYDYIRSLGQLGKSAITESVGQSSK